MSRLAYWSVLLFGLLFNNRYAVADAYSILGLLSPLKSVSGDTKLSAMSALPKKLERHEQHDMPLNFIDEILSFVIDEEEQVWLKKHPTVRVAIKNLGIPYDGIRANQQWFGPAADVLNYFAYVTGLKLQPVYIGEDLSAEEVIRNDIADVLISVPITQKISTGKMSSPYYSTNWSLVIQESRKGWPMYKVAKVGQAGWSTSNIPESKVNTVFVPSAAEALSLLEQSVVDAAYINFELATREIAQRYKGILHMVENHPYENEQVAFVVVDKYSHLFNLLNRFIGNLRQVDLQQLKNKWYLPEATQHTCYPNEVTVVIVPVLLIFIAIICALILVIRRVRIARVEAETANQAKSAFLAMMSHEIRTPMNGVMGVIDLLQTKSLNMEQQHLLQLAAYSAQTLLRVIDDILDYSKIETGKLELEYAALDLVETIESAVELYLPAAEKKGLLLRCLVSCEFYRKITGDSLRLRQMIGNLVDNALRFTQQGSIHVIAQFTADGYLKISVIDTGIGIAVEQQSRLFLPFSQADSSTTRQYWGSGLGLAIVKRMTDMLQGKIGLLSAPNKGTEIFITIPVNFAKENYSLFLNLDNIKVCVESNNILFKECVLGWLTLFSAIVVEHGEYADIKIIDKQKIVALSVNKYQTVLTGYFSMSKLFLTLQRYLHKTDMLPCDLSANKVLAPAAKNQDTVLLVEDNELNQAIVAKQLNNIGVDVKVASDGEKGLYCWQQYKPKLIFLDCHMPKMDGYALCRMIRQQEQEESLARTIIIALTANALLGEAEKCIAVGMDDYLVKPVSSSALQKILRKWLLKNNDDKGVQA